MRKLRLQMQMSLDGLISTGPNDEQQWVSPALDEILPEVLSIYDACDTILIGRKLAVDYIPFWQQTFLEPGHQMHVIAERIVAAKKVVFTQTLSESQWENTELAKGPLAEEVARLKSLPGKDLIVYGGSSFVAALIQADLIDEYFFFLNPVAIGQGESVFRERESFLRLELVSAKTYPSGVLLLNYLNGRKP